MRRLVTAFACVTTGALLVAGCGGGGEETGGEAAGAATDTAAAADSVSRVALGVDTLQGGGVYLTDGRGRALYLFTPDTAGTSTCYEKCATMWPPLAAPEGSVTVSGPVRSELVGYVSRRGGGTQVTYGGWPLYYFVKDRGSAVASGQDMHGFGGEWYLVTPAGTELHTGGGEESGSS